MVLDFLKISSDDAYYTPDHVVFLLNKFRAYVLKNKYDKGTETPSDTNYQTIKVNFEEIDRIEGVDCSGKYLRSMGEVPDSLDVGVPQFAGSDLFEDGISMVTPIRFKSVGFNRWMKNITYVTMQGGKVYVKSCNPLAYYLEEGTYRDIFADPLEAAAESGDYPVSEDGSLCEPMEVEFPLEDGLLPLVMQYVVKELSGGLYKPKDSENNANDDLSELANFIRTYVKSPLRQQIES
jgi:hypothetical protein